MVQTALTENVYRKALATKQWRYIANIGDQPDELYDQINDPWEINNLIDDPQYADLAHQLLRALLDRLAHAGRPITMFNNAKWRHAYDRDGRATIRDAYDSRDQDHL